MDSSTEVNGSGVGTLETVSVGGTETVFGILNPHTTSYVTRISSPSAVAMVILFF